MNKIDKMAEEVRLINNFSDYDLIEIEQINPQISRVEGIQRYNFKKKIDDVTDPANPSVSSISGKIDGGTLEFVENPYPRKPVGTGKVAYLVNDDMQADAINFPDGFLSGAERGYNLEFLASHYNEGLFKIIDPKWDLIVKERHEKLMEEKTKIIKKHIFDERYSVSGIGKPKEKEVKISIDSTTNELMAMVREMKVELDEIKNRNQELVKTMKKEVSSLPKKKKVLPKIPKEPPVKDVEAVPVNNFAQ